MSANPSRSPDAPRPTAEQIALVRRVIAIRRDAAEMSLGRRDPGYQANTEAMAAVLAHLDTQAGEITRLREALEGMLDALSVPSDDGETCAAHGEEIDLCDACCYDRQMRKLRAADNARAALTGRPAPEES